MIIDIAISMYVIGLLISLTMVLAIWGEQKTYQKVLSLLGCLFWFIVILFIKDKK